MVLLQQRFEETIICNKQAAKRPLFEGDGDMSSAISLAVIIFGTTPFAMAIPDSNSIVLGSFN